MAVHEIRCTPVMQVGMSLFIANYSFPDMRDNGDPC